VTSLFVFITQRPAGALQIPWDLKTPVSVVPPPMDALRWSSVPYCVAALVLATPSVERTSTVDEEPPLELATTPEVVISDKVTQVNNDDPPPPEPMPHRTWTGPCADQSELWKGPMKIMLDVTPPDGSRAEQLFISGELAFVDRRARLSTWETDYIDPMHEPRGRLLGGGMTEIGGLNTEWDVFMHVDRADARHLVGSLLERASDNSVNLICRFEWHR
jgi:hypothetical protein